MISQRRKARVRREWNAGKGITQCAKDCHMDPKTARKIIRGEDSVAPRQKRTYRTHTDPLEPFWPEIEELLMQDSKLKPYIILHEMLSRHPDKFQSSWRRTLERAVLKWKLEQRIEQVVSFDQDHLPGDVLGIDFTSMNDLAITIAGERFDHMVYHSVLTYSNWEHAEICLSESFEAVARGVQNTLKLMSGVPRRLRFDSMTAAVNNLSSDRHFQANFRRLLDHFSIEPHRINVRSPEENGDCESSHGHFKDYIDQRLRLRGSRVFATLAEYKEFMNR